MHGDGAYKWTNGDHYEGDFVENQREGHGRFDARNGDVYVGEFKGNEMAGHGIYRFADGAEYEGEFRDGRPVESVELLGLKVRGVGG